MKWSKLLPLPLVLVMSGCAVEQETDVTGLIVFVEDEEGRLVGGARVTVDGHDAGTTGRDGRRLVQLPGPEGRRARAEITCPEGQSIEGGAGREIIVTFLESLEQRRPALAPLVARFRCINRVRRSLLVVRTDGRDGLPVRMNGGEIGRTDEDGVVQAVIEGAEGEEIEIVIDTTEDPELRPSMPARRLLVPRVSQILVFDQQFEERRIQHVKPARARIQRRKGPRRI